ncbi:PA3496 family putative envelope integrity protein [Legionella sp.]|uniref:PA3496 family putative envelope integrity protein n=1 Tax=Legionella sp. TaxID=459 RepID=UPI003CC2A2E0
MSTCGFDEDENVLEDFSDNSVIITESNPSTKLERRRKIEDLLEEKRLKEELTEFG